VAAACVCAVISCCCFAMLLLRSAGLGCCDA
jgi:hypothetical protein